MGAPARGAGATALGGAEVDSQADNRQSTTSTPVTTSTQAHALSLPDIAAAIVREHEAAQRHAASAVDHARCAGELLAEAKAGLEHGRWLPWLAENVKFSPRTAQAYMQLARAEDPQRVAHLPLRQAVAYLSTPRPDPVDRREEVGDDDHQPPAPVYVPGLPGERRRRLDVHRVINETVISMAGCAHGLDLLDGQEDLLREIDLDDVRQWRGSLNRSLKRLRRLSAALKKLEVRGP